MYYYKDIITADKLHLRYTEKISDLFEEQKILTENDELFFNSSVKKSNDDHFSEKKVGDIYRTEFLNNVRGHIYKKEIFYEYVISKRAKNFTYLMTYKLSRDYKMAVNNLYIDYKSYISDIQAFYHTHSGFHKILKYYPYTMRIEMFFENLQPKLFPKYSGNNIELFFSMIEKIIDANYLSLNEQDIIDAQKEMHRYIKDNNKRISGIATRIYNKFSQKKYKGIHCPDNLAFIPLLDKTTANEIAKILVTYVFIPGTSTDVIENILRSKITIIDDEEKKHYESNPHIQAPPIITNKKLGYLIYALKMCNLYDLIRVKIKKSNYGVYTKLAKSNLFKVNKKNHEPYYPTPVHLKNAYSDSFGKYENYNRVNDIEQDNPDFWMFKNAIDKIIENYILKTKSS